jgi:DNA-binding NarL/FixJ family response regulator
MRLRLLIADDHRIVREGVRALLSSQDYEIVAETADGREAIRLARLHQPDIALLDVTMPSLNGMDATREVARVAPQCRVIVLSMHRDRAYVLEALRAGARGYVVKTQAASELITAITRVARGEPYLSPDLSRVVVEAYSDGRNGERPLTPREREVLQLIAEGKTTKEIAAALSISFKTAESHRQRLMAKLDIHETASLVRYAIRNGMIEA